MRIALYLVLVGVLGWFAAFQVMPLAVQWEFSPAAVDRIPLFGFAVGAGLGLAMALSEPVCESGWFVLGSLVTGWVVWLFVVLVVGLGLSVGGFEGDAFDQAMEPVNTAATWLGWLVAIGLIGLGAYALLYEKAALLEQFRPKRRR